MVPARGGSKRIPLKNIRSMAGRPLLAWPIDAARDSGLFDRIIVSTDNHEIAERARACGAEVPFVRPEALSGDHVGTLEVMRHAADWAAQSTGTAITAICCLYPTALFTLPDDLRRGFDCLKRGGWDYVFAAAALAAPVQRAFVRANGGAMRLLFPEHGLSRTQDLDQPFIDVGQFYWGQMAAWRDGRPIFGNRTSFIELPSERVQDIDTPEDWTKAELMFGSMRGSFDE